MCGFRNIEIPVIVSENRAAYGSHSDGVFPYAEFVYNLADKAVYDPMPASGAIMQPFICHA
jgi:hypothetical protein